MSYLVDPVLMHGVCSDGFRVKRPTAFGLVYAAYMAYGLVSGAAIFLSRVLTSVAVSLVHLVSLDISVLPERYAHLDAGHVAFMSLVRAHHNHHNSALHVAAEALAAPDRRATRARARWHLAYTLLNNPGLRRDRRSRAPPRGAPPSAATKADALADLLAAAVARPDARAVARPEPGDQPPGALAALVERAAAAIELV